MPSALGYLLHRNARSVRALAERAFACESALTFTQFITLIALRDGIASTPSDVARELGLNSGGVTRMLDQLEYLTLIRRERSRSDRRSISLILTGSGATMVHRLLPRLLALWRELLNEFSDEEYRTLLTLQLRLNDAIEKAASVAFSMAPPHGGDVLPAWSQPAVGR
jgi:DNA-binding MarR family transcriptional regulator